MNKNYQFYFLLLFVIISFIFSPLAFTKEKFSLKNFESNNYSLKESAFKNAEKIIAKRNALFSFDADIKLGLGIANTNFDFNYPDTSGNLSNTSSKIGPAVGALVSLNFLGYGFTTGFMYSNKGFQNNSGFNTNLNYFNIPLLIYFDFAVGKKLRVEGNLGPYFGLLLSQTESPLYKVKNFDLGLKAELQFAYMLNNYIGVLLGANYEYGGLNNLGNNEFIKKITTSSINIYSGLKFEL